MERFQYLILMGLCVAITLPLEFVLGARVWRNPRRLLAAMVPTFTVFVIWDVVAIRWGHWTFNPRYTTGWRIGNIPIEELVFFIVIPICALLSFEAVENLLPTVRRWLGRTGDPVPDAAVRVEGPSAPQPGADFGEEAAVSTTDGGASGRRGAEEVRL